MKVRGLLFLVFKKIVRLLWGKDWSKFPPVNKIYQLLYEHLRPRDVVFIEIEGNKIYVEPPHIGMAAYSCTHQLLCGTYEKLTTELLKKQIKPGMTVVDLGANIGYFALLAAKLVGNKGKVFAFEPAPNNYALLTKNIATNGYNNVITIQKAVSNRTRQVRLFLSDFDAGSHNLYKSQNQKSNFVEVDAITLDEFFKDEDLPIDFIKMDIEGAEMEALEGMSGIISKNQNLKIITEFCPLWLRRAGTSADEFLNKLTGYGFKLYDINERKGNIIPRDVSSILKVYSGVNRKTNLLCLMKSDLGD